MNTSEQPYQSTLSSPRHSGDLLIEYPDGNEMMQEQREQLDGEMTELQKEMNLKDHMYEGGPMNIHQTPSLNYADALRAQETLQSTPAQEGNQSKRFINETPLIGKFGGLQFNTVPEDPLQESNIGSTADNTILGI